MSSFNSQLKNIFADARRSSFIQNVFVVMSGTAIAQAIGLALSPVISRLFSPSDFGVYGSFSAILSIITAFVTLDYTLAIMLPKQKGDALNLFFVSCLSTFFVTSLCLIYCLFFPSTVNGVLKTTGFWIIALLVIGVLVTGLNTSCSAWCVRVKAFKATSSSQIIRSISSNGAQLGLGFLKGGAASLILAVILAEIVATMNLLRSLIPDIKALRHEIRWSQMKQMMKEYRDFPFYSAFPNIVDAVSRDVPVLLLSYFYGLATAGAYAFSMRIIQAPAGIITGALRQVLFQKGSEIKNLGSCLLPLYIKITAGLFCLVVLPAFILALWATPIFTWVFGSKWQTAGQFASYLVLWVAVMFCNTPAILFGRIIRIQQKMFLWRISTHSIRILTLCISGMYLSQLSAIFVFSMVGVAINICTILIVGYYLMKLEGVTLRGGIQNFIK